MNDQGLRFRIGVFVLAAMILLAVLIILFSGLPTIFVQHRQYTIVFDDAPGVAPGTPVRRSGVRIGEVKSVELDDETGKVRVTIVVEKRYTLRKNERPTLTTGLLGSDISIDFIPEPPDGAAVDRSPVEPGAELTGVKQADPRSLMTQAAAAMPDLQRTNAELQIAARNWGRVGERTDLLLRENQDRMVRALENFDDTVRRIGSVFSDENQKNLNATLKNVKAGSDSLESMTKNTDQLLKESRETLHRVNESIKQTDKVLTNLQKATEPMAERGGAMMKNLDESTEQLNRLLGEIRELVRLLGRGDGTLQRLLSDPALYNNVNDAACMLTRLMPRLDRILRDMEVFADKLARHPESLGLGGVVRPSAGLKEAPSAGNGRWSHGPGH